MNRRVRMWLAAVVVAGGGCGGSAPAWGERDVTQKAGDLAKVVLSLSAGELIAMGDESFRYEPTVRPGVPEAQHPPASSSENVDTGKPVHEWQRLTDDWGGWRPKLDDRGISVNGSLTGYAGKNFLGGNSRSGGFAYMANVNLTLDTQKLAGWKGGTFFVNFRQQQGLARSRDGAFQTTSDLYIERRTQVSELWYEQKLLDDKLRVKVGKIDASSDFAGVKNGEEFLNSSVQEPSTILGFPTDPDPACGLEVFGYPTEHVYAGIGVFDGAGQAGVRTGDRGVSTLFGAPHDLFVIGEVGAKWELGENKLEGRLGVGGWHHSGDFARFDGGMERGTSGFYVVGEQGLWKPAGPEERDERGVRLFAHYGWADPKVSQAEHQISAGLTWTGMIAGRDADVAGVGVDWTRFSAAERFAKRDEMVVEGFYQIRVLKWLSVKPDLQYVIHPGGEEGKDSLAGVIQVIVDF